MTFVSELILKFEAVAAYGELAEEYVRLAEAFNAVLVQLLKAFIARAAEAGNGCRGIDR